MFHGDTPLPCLRLSILDGGTADFILILLTETRLLHRAETCTAKLLNYLLCSSCLSRSACSLARACSAWGVLRGSAGKRMAPYVPAAIAAPMSGAMMNNQSCSRAQPPTKIAGPMLRAGLTEVLVMGIPTRWIKVNTKPMANPAKPTGALISVDPSTVKTKNIVKTVSATKAAAKEYWPGECS